MPPRKAIQAPWLFGKEHVEVNVNRMKGQWVQWCPIPADIRDGVLMRGNVIYQNPDGTYRQSADLYEGVIETQGDRYFVGKTQHIPVTKFAGRTNEGDSQHKDSTQRAPCL